MPAGGEEALLLPPSGRCRAPIFEEVPVDVSGTSFNRMADLRRKRPDDGQRRSGDDTWSSSEDTSRPGTGSGNPFTDDDDDNEYHLLVKTAFNQSVSVGLSTGASQESVRAIRVRV